MHYCLVVVCGAAYDYCSFDTYFAKSCRLRPALQELSPWLCETHVKRMHAPCMTPFELRREATGLYVIQVMPKTLLLLSPVEDCGNTQTLAQAVPESKMHTKEASQRFASSIASKQCSSHVQGLRWRWPGWCQASEESADQWRGQHET